jgi:aminoglycoside 3-N-acetyltransferase I
MSEQTLVVRRLGPADQDRAARLFALMAAVFEAPSSTLPDAYVAALLARADFWALAAMQGDAVIGGLTAHTLPMTRAATSELMIYDLAVHDDWQRRGVGRALVMALRAAAAREGIDDVFVPADVEDAHALAFYEAIGGSAAPVTIFTFAAGSSDT